MSKDTNLQKQLSKYKSIFTEAMYPKLIVNNAGRILEVNQACEKVFGKNFDKKKIFEYMPTKSTKHLRRFWKNLRQEGIQSDTLEFTIEKQRYVFLVNATADIQPNTNLLILDDITKDVITQESRDQFIAVAGHELKTPLAVIKAYSELLQRRADGDEKTDQYTSKIIGKVDILTRLINAIVDEIKLGAGRLEFNNDELDIDEFVEQHVEHFRIAYPTMQISLEGQTQAKATVDSQRLSQVLTSLIANAVKYTEKGKKITVHLTMESEKAIIGVQDFGKGISKKDQAKLFSAFFRSPDVIRKNYPGIGLGLYISKQIVTYYGGDMWLESKWGEGSTFYFSIPVS